MSGFAGESDHETLGGDWLSVPFLLVPQGQRPDPAWIAAHPDYILFPNAFVPDAGAGGGAGPGGAGGRAAAGRLAEGEARAGAGGPDQPAASSVQGAGAASAPAGAPPVWDGVGALAPRGAHARGDDGGRWGQLGGVPPRLKPLGRADTSAEHTEA